MQPSSLTFFLSTLTQAGQAEIPATDTAIHSNQYRDLDHRTYTHALKSCSNTLCQQTWQEMGTYVNTKQTWALK